MGKDLKNKIAELRVQIGKISKDKKNPFFNSEYFDINKLLDNLQPHLMELNIDIIQPLKDGKVITIVRDLDSDETESSELELPKLDDPQKMGSAITYYRRYTLQSLLALQAEDDDGNKASGNTKSRQSSNKDDREWLNKTHKNSDDLTNKWKNAVKAIRNGKYTADQIISSYRMKSELKDELKSIETSQ